MKKTTGINRWLWLAVPIVLAAACAAARRWQAATAFEGELSLPIPFAPASVVLLAALIVSCAGLLLLAVRQASPVRPSRWDVYLVDQTDLVYPCAMVAAAFLALLAVPDLFRQGWNAWRIYHASIPREGNNGLLAILTAVGAVAAFAGLLLVAKAGRRPGKRARGGYAAALPALAGCMWLMDSYRVHAADPVLWDYAPLLLAVVAGMLFYVDLAGMSSGMARPRRLLWLAGMTVILSAVALCAGCGRGDALLLLSQLLAALAVLWRLPAKLAAPAAEGRRVPRETEEIQEDTPDE